MLPIEEIIKEMNSKDPFSFFSLKVNVGKFLLSYLREFYKNSPNSFNYLEISESLAKTVQKAVDYINSNYHSDITADTVAKYVGLSYNYFSNCFSHVTGQTFRQYLNKTRIKHAKHLLLCSSLNINEISDAVGYNSVSYFILEFRKQTGMTPAKFAKKHSRNNVSSIQ